MSDYFSGDHQSSQGPSTAFSRMQTRRKPIKLSTALGMGFKGTWPMQIVTLACIIVFVLQVLGPLLGMFGVPNSLPAISLYDYAFSPRAMEEGRWWTILTCMFLHGGIIHIWFNLSAYMSVAPMVFRRFGKGLLAFGPFFVFYIVTGLAGNLLFWALHPGSDVPVVGASGAIFGIWGGMIRLNPFTDRLERFFSPAVMRGWLYFTISNLIVVVLIGGPVALMQIAGGQPLQNLFIPIAWEAHLGGFVAGLLLIGVMAPKSWDQAWKAGMLARMDVAAPQ
jgi:membrane associated rhomboid family serine protease